MPLPLEVSQGAEWWNSAPAASSIYPGVDRADPEADEGVGRVYPKREVSLGYGRLELVSSLPVGLRTTTYSKEKGGERVTPPAIKCPLLPMYRDHSKNV